MTGYTQKGVTISFVYDAAGNLLRDNRAEDSYDGFNRTVRVETFDGHIQVNRYEYDAWGNLVECEERVTNRFAFAGEQLDPLTQQYYLRARYYNPVMARFTQEDTYRGDGLNLYTYCRNNPVYYVDPSGHMANCQKDAYEEYRKEGMTAAEAYQKATGKNPLKVDDSDSANILNKPLLEWTNEDIQRATDSIHNAQYGGKWYGSKNPIAVTISSDGRVIVSKNNGVPGPKSREMAVQIFGENVEFVRGGKKSNYVGGADSHHAEARGIQYMLNNGIETEEARQGISSYSCGRCEGKQRRHGVINVTGNASEHGGRYGRNYVNDLWILEGEQN